jgi:nucleotide-binding universal stress UspA family protein
MKILVPVDGSDNSLRALRHLIENRDEEGRNLELHLLNVQLPVASGAVKMFIHEDQLRQYYQDEAQQALRSARSLLKEAGVAYEHHIIVGDVASTIARFAKESACARIVMGARGLGELSGILMGSVTTRVIQLTEIPVLLVK